MTKVHVHYEVPVSALVDTETGKVDEVLIWREAIEECSDWHAVVEEETRYPASNEQRVRAYEIVDSEAWPEWRFA